MTRRRWVASGRPCSRGADAHRRAGRLRDPAHRARRAGARPVLLSGCPSRSCPTRGCTSTSAGARARPRWCSGRSTWAPTTSTSARATCRGWCSPTRRGTRSASWRSAPSTPPRARSRRCRSTVPTRRAMPRSGPSCPAGSRCRRRCRRRCGTRRAAACCSSCAPNRHRSARTQEPAAPRHPPRAGRRPGWRGGPRSRAGWARVPTGLGRPAVAGRHRPLGQRALPPAREVTAAHLPAGSDVSSVAASPDAAVTTVRQDQGQRAGGTAGRRGGHLR